MSQSSENPFLEPTPPVPVPAPELSLEKPNFFRQKSRPLLGGVLWTFGALLWAYLVMGELVVHFELNEVLAVLVVAAVLGISWYGAARHAPAGNLGRKIAPGVLGIVLFFVALVFVSAVFGSSRQRTVEALTVAFWFPALLAYVLGRNLIRAPKPERSRPQRVGVIALWIASSLVTALALLSATTRM